MVSAISRCVCRAKLVAGLICLLPLVACQLDSDLDRYSSHDDAAASDASDSAADQTIDSSDTPVEGGDLSDELDFRAPCEESCDRFAASACEQPETVEECKAHCETMSIALRKNTDCSEPFAKLYACKNLQPVDCEKRAFWEIVGCDAENETAQTCLKKYVDQLKCQETCESEVPTEPCAPNDHTSVNNCMFGCQFGGFLILLESVCFDMYKDWVNCKAAHEMTCVEHKGEKQFTAAACLPLYDTLYDCLPAGE